MADGFADGLMVGLGIITKSKSPNYQVSYYFLINVFLLVHYIQGYMTS